MNLGEEIIKPDNLRKPDFCVGSFEPKELKFKCCSSKDSLSIKFKTQINNGWGGKSENITDSEVDILKKYYSLSQNAKAPGGGFPTFDLIKCSKCKKEYYTFCGVDEFRYGAYAVYVQGVVAKQRGITQKCYVKQLRKG